VEQPPERNRLEADDGRRGREDAERQRGLADDLGAEPRRRAKVNERATGDATGPADRFELAEDECGGRVGTLVGDGADEHPGGRGQRHQRKRHVRPPP